VSTQTTTDLRATLLAALAASGHDVEAADVARASGALAGPLLVIRLPLRSGSGMEATVVASDRDGIDAEQLVQRLAEDAAAALGPLVAGDASIEVADGLATVTAAFGAPIEVGLVRLGGAVVGAVLCATDRRATTPGSGAPGPAPGPVGSAPSRRPAPTPALGGGAQTGLHLLRDVRLDVTVELGRADLTVAEVLELTVGAVVELDRAARAPVDVRVNGTLLARGEVVVIDDEYAVRITEIVDPAAGDEA
jgi:flagellar motor switch protein FliN/FliY